MCATTSGLALELASSTLAVGQGDVCRTRIACWRASAVRVGRRADYTAIQFVGSPVALNQTQIGTERPLLALAPQKVLDLTQDALAVTSLQRCDRYAGVDRPRFE